MDVKCLFAITMGLALRAIARIARYLSYLNENDVIYQLTEAKKEKKDMGSEHFWTSKCPPARGQQYYSRFQLIFCSFLF